MIIFSFSLVIFCWWVFFFFFTLVICSCPFPPFPIAVYLCWSYINLFLNLLPVFSWHSFNCTNCFYVCVVIIGLCYGLTEVSLQFSSVRSLSRVRLFATPGISTPGLLVHHHLLEFTQTHIHRVGDAIQPSHPLSSPFPPVPNPSQHQSLFQWVNSSREVAKVLEFSALASFLPKNTQGWSPLEWTGWITVKFVKTWVYMYQWVNFYVCKHLCILNLQKYTCIFPHCKNFNTGKSHSDPLWELPPSVWCIFIQIFYCLYQCLHKTNMKISHSICFVYILFKC